MTFWQWLYQQRGRGGEATWLQNDVFEGMSLARSYEKPPCCYATTANEFLAHFEAAHRDVEPWALDTARKLASEWNDRFEQVS